MSEISFFEVFAGTDIRSPSVMACLSVRCLLVAGLVPCRPCRACRVCVVFVSCLCRVVLLFESSCERVFFEKSVEILKKSVEKVWKSGKERYLCSPVPEGGPRGSSADRGKFIESEEGSPSGAGGAGPLRPGEKTPAGARKEDESRIIQ